MAENSWYSSPLNLGLLAVFVSLLYLNYQKQRKPISTPRPVEIKKKEIIMRTFTPKELAVFNGTKEPKKEIYISLKGKVYDVSSKPDFYGPGSMYENFSGRDASRGMAKHSFELDVLTSLDEPLLDRLEDLNKEEKEALEEWSDFFSNKYPLVGTMIDDVVLVSEAKKDK